MTHDLEALTEKEKEAPRLLLVGHDAKSMARALDLSVHTINDRLRHARRKLAVPSSKVAARLLHDWEGEEGVPVSPAGLPPADPRRADAANTASTAPQSLGHKTFGDAQPPVAGPDGTRKAGDASVMHPALWIAGGLAMISVAIALFALSAPADSPPTTPSTEATQPAAASAIVRDWLQLVDAGNWEASYEATADSFRSVNTLELWSSVSEDVRVPLGAVTSREAVSEELIPGGPRGLSLVRFRTSFANRADVTETLSLSPEGGTCKVSGYIIE